MTPRACTPRRARASSRVSALVSACLTPCAGGVARSAPLSTLLAVAVACADTDFALPAEFTGVSAPYEAPEKPELHIKTAEVDIPTGVQIIVDYLEKNKFI